MLKRKPTGRAVSMPTGLTFGGIVSLLITVAMAAVIAKLVDAETLPWEKVGYGIMILLFVASYAGAMTAYGSIKRQRLVVALLSGAVYLGILVAITALFFGGQYEAVGATGAVVLGGAGVAALPGISGGKRRRSRKTQIRRC